MKSKIHIIAILLFLFYNEAYCQLENANWYFGQNGTGLNFNGTTSVLTNGPNGDLQTYYASISDENGQLLFTTDGTSVWNRNQIIMQNGTNLNGLQHAVVIVPFPGNSNKYYIFTVRAQSGQGGDGYFYSVVDMNLSGGLGSVVSKNINLNVLPYIHIDPKLGIISRYNIQRPNNVAVAKHSDGESYWLILNPFDMFFAIKIDSSGISPNSVITQADGDYDSGYHFGTSGISVSPEMDKIAYFTLYYPNSSPAINLYIYSFNNSTGVFGSGSYFPTGNLAVGHSAEFSADGNFLYLLEYFQSIGYRIYQTDLQNSVPTSPLLIGESNGPNFYPNTALNYATLRRAIDGRIYVPSTYVNKLGVINNPNNFGANCNYADQQLTINGYAAILPPNVLFQEYGSNCPLDLVITQTVNTGQTDMRKAQETITALNIIQSGAIATYDASTSVKLSPGFWAKQGSNFRGYIEGCLPRNANKSKTEINNDLSAVKVHPNPATNELYVTTVKSKLNLLEIYDLYGNGVEKIEKLNSYSYQIDVTKFNRGYFILKITLDNGSVEFKNIILN